MLFKSIYIYAVLNCFEYTYNFRKWYDIVWIFQNQSLWTTPHKTSNRYLIYWQIMSCLHTDQAAVIINSNTRHDLHLIQVNLPPIIYVRPITSLCLNSKVTITSTIRENHQPWTFYNLFILYNPRLLKC